MQLLCRQSSGQWRTVRASPEATRRLTARDGTPAYLEASSPRARDLYLRHGYAMRRGSAFRLPEGPLLWPMWREPRIRIEDREGHYA
jgi:hypothetical protein